jgi:hypothetical protein
MHSQLRDAVKETRNAKFEAEADEICRAREHETGLDLSGTMAGVASTAGQPIYICTVLILHLIFLAVCFAL